MNILNVFYYPHARNENCDFMQLNTDSINQTLHKYYDINLKNRGNSLKALNKVKIFSYNL